MAMPTVALVKTAAKSPLPSFMLENPAGRRRRADPPTPRGRGSNVLIPSSSLDDRAAEGPVRPRVRRSPANRPRVAQQLRLRSGRTGAVGREAGRQGHEQFQPPRQPPVEAPIDILVLSSTSRVGEVDGLTSRACSGSALPSPKCSIPPRRATNPPLADGTTVAEPVFAQASEGVGAHSDRPDQAPK
jgi:hypothetical protein